MALGARRRRVGIPRGRPAWSPAWLTFLLGGTFAACFYYLMPEILQAALFFTAPATATVLGARAVRLARPGGRAVWLALTAALALATVSDVLYLSYPLTTGHEAPFPSLLDATWLASYPCYLLAIWAMLRQQRDADRAGSVLDAAIIAVNGGILLWIFVLDPVIEDPHLPAITRLVSVLYPTMDVLVFAAMVRFVVTARTTVAMRLLLAALTALLTADIGYIVQLTNGTFDNWGPSDALWILSALLVGAAALHPRNGDFVSDARGEQHRLTPSRMGFLFLALLVGPIVLSQKPDDMLLLAGMSSVSFGLVTARMWLLSHNLASARAAVLRTSDLLVHQSLHDPLTGLPNRALMLDRIGRMQAQARRSSQDCALLLLDLDGFKAVNDALGHEAGDRLLIAVAERLRNGLPDAHSIGRIGGDEFAVLVDGDVTGGAPELVAERVLDLVHQPFDLGDATHSTLASASIGIAVGSRVRPSELLREADVALYEAKAAGRNCYEQFRPEMEAVIQRRYELDTDLRSALQRDEFFLHYQPVYGLDDLRVTGFEALLRWNHPAKGLIGPNEFIPLLEASGLIVDVGRWVLRAACRQAAEWAAAGREISMSVNVSARQLDRDSVVEHVADALRESGLRPGRLNVEITETALMSNVAETTRRLRELKALGVRIAIDDFGTGYCSLAYLQQFPVDCLKIDRTFTSAIGTSPESDAMIHTFVQLGTGLGLETVAEGVETPAQLRHLRGEGVHSVQGFLLARPLPTREATRLLFTRAEAPAIVAVK